MPILITLPCKPMVKQYIINRYGDPVVFPNNDRLKNLLLKNLTWPNRNNETQRHIQHYTEEILLPIKISEYVRAGNTLTANSIVDINEVIRDDINEILYKFLDMHHRDGEGILLKEAIQKFREEYNFPEETYKQDAIVKYFQRERKRRRKNLTK